MLLAVRQNRLGFLFIDQIKGKMGGDVAECESHQGPLLQAVIYNSPDYSPELITKASTVV